MSEAIATFVAGHAVELIENTEPFIELLEREIEAAREFFWLESYIFAADEVGFRVLAALTRAARRGVAVRLLVDGYGSFELVRDHAARIRSAGIELAVYRPLHWRGLLRRTRLSRLHRKLACRDGVAALLGGINIAADRLLCGAKPGCWVWDFAVRFEGPLVAELQAEMARMWYLVYWANHKRRLRLLFYAYKQQPYTHSKAVAAKPESFFPVALALLWRTPLRYRYRIEQSYLAALARAEQEVWIVAAYFFPGRRFREALAAAARRGVAVHLVLQGLSDHPWMREATRTLYPWLLQAGVCIYELDAIVAHAKVAVIDKRYATVGSSNIDPLSLFLAREANLWVDDPSFAGLLQERIQKRVAADGTRCHAAVQQSLMRRLVGWIMVGLVRLFLGLTGLQREMDR